MFRRLRNSLIARVTVVSVAVVALTLLVSGLALRASYEASLARIVNNHITAYADLLVSHIKLQDGRLMLYSDDAILRMPRYWQVSMNGRNLYKSDNLANWIARSPENLANQQDFTADSGDGTVLRVVQATYLFPHDARVTLLFGLEKRVADAYLAEERRNLESPLVRTLLAEGALLAFLSFLLTRYAVAPMRGIKAALRSIRAGKSERIEGRYPQEIGALADEINHLLDYSAGIIARHREFSANLAHSLKTPMTVIRNESDLKRIREKADAMLQIIDRSLARANAAPGPTLPSAAVAILPVLEDIAGGFAKVYGKAVELDYPAEPLFRGDRADLFEVLGNIIENACKFARLRVRITQEDGAVVIEDDGEGIPEARRREVLERGIRLDRSTPGTGIGLAVARDIIALYKGSITLGASTLWGLKVTVVLPLQR